MADGLTTLTMTAIHRMICNHPNFVGTGQPGELVNPYDAGATIKWKKISWVDSEGSDPLKVPALDILHPRVKLYERMHDADDHIGIVVAFKVYNSLDAEKGLASQAKLWNLLDQMRDLMIVSSQNTPFGQENGSTWYEASELSTPDAYIRYFQRGTETWAGMVYELKVVAHRLGNVDTMLGGVWGPLAGE